jgi:hypothetical protein
MSTVQPKGSEGRRLLPHWAPAGSTPFSIDLSPAAWVAFKNLVEETGESPGALIVKALGLYRLASAAKKEGKAVGVAPSPEDLETEFTGF